MMRGIDRLSHQLKTSQAKQQSAAEKPKKEGASVGDSVEISQNAKSVSDLSELAESTPAQSNADLDQIREKVRSGFYNTSEALGNVADAMIESEGLQDTVAEIAQFQALKDQLSQVPDVRAEEVERTKQLSDRGIYNQRQTLEGTADGIINEIA